MRKTVRLVLPIIAIGLAVLLAPNVARAESLSWANSKPVVTSSTKVTLDNRGDWCNGFVQSKEISGTYENKKVCVTAGGGVKFGNYFNGRSYSYVVGISYDSKMYQFNGPCFEDNDCLYLSGSDTLVAKQYSANGLVRTLAVYKNFMNRLSRKLDGFSYLYNFNSSNPDYIFKSGVSDGYPDGYAWPIGGLAASDNGKWLAVEFRERGYGLLNIETLQMKRISTNRFSYGFGYDPATELAVGGDGEYVAVMGANAGISVFDVDENCGDIANDSNMFGITPIGVPCRTAQIDTSEFVDRFKVADHPRFSSDGGQLGFLATSYTYEVREILLQVNGYAGQKLDYLAMGDSYQSGEGETSDKHYLDGTNNIYEKCHVSDRSYPFVLANVLDLDLNYVKNVACSGAEMVDIYGKDSTYLGQGDRLGMNGMNLSKSDRIIAQTQAKFSFIQGRVHQINFAQRYQPRVITIGIGGNDAGFIKKLTACVGRDTCSWAGTTKGRAQTAQEIKSLFPKLVQTYQEIHFASPASKIYVIGYPKIIDQNGYCGASLTELLDKNEMEFMNEGVRYLNQVIEVAARSAGVKYIDIYNGYGDSVLCGDSSDKSVNGIRFGDDNTIFDILKQFRPIGQESFHPTPLGHFNNVIAITSSVGNIMNYDYCGFGVSFCPDSTIVAPDPTSAWWGGSYRDYPTHRISDFIIDKADIYGFKKFLRLAQNALMPGSIVGVSVMSTPVDLGSFTVSGDGSLDIAVDLPTDLEDGYHTLYINGTSYSGEPIELYQIFEYQKPKATPIEQPDQINSGAIESVIANSPELILNLENNRYSFPEQILGASVVKNQQQNANSTDKKEAEIIQNNDNDSIGFLIIYAVCCVILVLAIRFAKRYYRGL